MSELPRTPDSGAAIGLDHVGIVGASLDALAEAFIAIGFALTPFAAHASGRTGNRCAMLRDGGYLELMATIPGQSSATLDRFLVLGAGAHVLAMEVANETAAVDRLRRTGIAAAEVTITERDAGPAGAKARFALIMPPDSPERPPEGPPGGPPKGPPEGRVLLIRHLTRDLLWHPRDTAHPNGAVALTEVVYGVDSPARTMVLLSLLSGRPAEPDPMGGYRIRLDRGTARVLPRSAAERLFAGGSGAPPLVGLTIAVETPAAGPVRVVHAGGVAIRFVGAPA